MANFSEEQLNRYESFRRSAFQKSTVKKVLHLNKFFSKLTQNWQLIILWKM